MITAIPAMTSRNTPTTYQGRRVGVDDGELSVDEPAASGRPDSCTGDVGAAEGERADSERADSERADSGGIATEYTVEPTPSESTSSVEPRIAIPSPTP
jgi:hypothetical protein